ncbi:MAG: alpha/beta fold hydrolase [Candidatus Pacebacteria bacterium]|nr:alpha/beta fold hydrolase [Candidatus Paceibacterota bacterium]
MSSGNIKNTTSARVSTPATLVEKVDSKGNKVFAWRTDLLKTKEYWEGWFRGLSKAFLAVPILKELVLAGSDRMDKELTIAQMQGKFKIEVVPEVGHVVQEDSPKRVAQSFINFITTFRIHELADHQEFVTSVSGKTINIGPAKTSSD